MASPVIAQQLYAFPIDATIMLAAGDPSNNGGFRIPCNGWLGRVHISREGPSLGLWTRQAAVQVSRLPAGVDILARRSCQLGARISIDAVLASRERLGYYVQVVAAIAATQLALVLDRAQEEAI